MTVQVSFPDWRCHVVLELSTTRTLRRPAVRLMIPAPRHVNFISLTDWLFWIRPRCRILRGSQSAEFLEFKRESWWLFCERRKYHGDWIGPLAISRRLNPVAPPFLFCRIERFSPHLGVTILQRDIINIIKKNTVIYKNRTRLLFVIKKQCVTRETLGSWCSFESTDVIDLVILDASAG